MDENRLDVLLAPYNPWWTTTGWDSILPAYRRPIVSEVLADLKELPQIISVTGPRRVGKTTAASCRFVGIYCFFTDLRIAQLLFL